MTNDKHTYVQKKTATTEEGSASGDPESSSG
jgi:hypothetical protein